MRSRVERSVNVIRKPRLAVFRELSNFENWSAWFAGIRNIEALRGWKLAFANGRADGESMGYLVRSTFDNELVEWDAIGESIPQLNEIRLVHRLSPMHLDIRLRVTDAGGSRSEVLIAVSSDKYQSPCYLAHNSLLNFKVYMEAL